MERTKILSPLRPSTLLSAEVREEQAASEKAPDLWLFFEALKRLPVGLLHGVNSDILLPETVAEMRRRHPGLIVGEVPDRGHVPFLDEPQCLDVIRAVLAEAECLTLT